MDINWSELRSFISDLLLCIVLIWNSIDNTRLDRRVSRLERRG